MIEIYFLGTSSTFPTKNRNHSGILLRINGKNILLDAGEGVQRQLRKIDISPTILDYILITHWHGDHMLGLPGIIFSLINSEYKKDLNIILPEENIEDLKKLFEVLKIETDFNINIIGAKEGLIVKDNDINIFGKKLKHSITCYGYSIKLDDKINIDKEKIKEYNLSIDDIKKIKEGKEIDYNGKILSYKDVGYLKKGIKISYITDTLYFDDIIDFVRDSDILISESTYFFQPDLAKEHYHMDFLEVRDIFKRSNSKFLFLTHFSQRYDKEMNLIRKDIMDKEENKRIYIMEDFDKIIINEKDRKIEIYNNNKKYIDILD